MKTKKINGKHYIDAGVLIIKTENPSGLFVETNDYKGYPIYEKKLEFTTNETLIRNNHLISNKRAATNVQNEYEFYNLYVVSDEKPNKGDWVAWRYNDEIILRQVIQNRKELGVKLEGCAIYDISKCFMKKVIATTNSNINEPDSKIKDITYSMLPNLPADFIEQFVESYNKGSVITNILVEAENVNKGWQSLANSGKVGSTHVPDKFDIKVDENDKINITTRAFEFLKKYPKESLGNKNEDWSKLSKIGSPEKWIEMYIHYQDLLVENDAREFVENIPKPKWDDIYNDINTIEFNSKIEVFNYLKKNYNPPIKKYEKQN